MTKIDFKKASPALYRAPTNRFALVEVPAMHFVMVDGAGDPNTAPAYKQAVEWLFSVSYAMKFAAKASLGNDYVVPPLEGLWEADDPADFVTRRKDRWRWTMMIRAPDFLDDAMFGAAVERSKKKLGTPPDSLRMEIYDEGPSLQILHIGAYDHEGPALARLHHEEMPSRGYVFAGRHHEIYLSDPRKPEPAKLRTILRQPVRRGA
ncbi:MULTISPECIES: GyrI-like domain-containing protein [Methylocystis]|uniref:GyrI-like domain-containing protein n=1 Tax=Methylocystis TaxID=133 RepID=UPI0024BB9065|nr:MULTISPECIES: GyrI-like domain-containing protein [Methylocystis]MDJ0448393.1 GyrI-like domain-containing protein [Methylocystis sp. JR02]